MTQLAGKVVWITGASSGIGEALAVLASRRGAKLILTARREAELQRVRAACADPAQVAILPQDLGDMPDPEAVARRAAEFFGPVDVLVNNAGVSQRTVTTETSMDTYRKLFEVDFFSTVALTKAVVPPMLARGAGHLVVVSSVFGSIAMARRSGYAAAKHALHGFYDCLRIEEGNKGLQVTLVCPGFVATGVSRNALGPGGQPWGRTDGDIGSGMDPLVCAERTWRAVERNALQVTIARIERLAVWFKHYLPLSWYTAFARRLKVH